MNLGADQLQTLAQKAITAARAAGEVISQSVHKDVQIQQKDKDTSVATQVVTEVDHKAQAVILGTLEPTCGEYNLALLTEEAPDTCERLMKPAFWSIDPMDGTLAFINKTPGYAVSIALVARNGTPLIGVVYDPVTNNLFYAIKNAGVYRNEIALKIPPLDSSQPLVLQTDPSFQHHPWFEQTFDGLQKMASKIGLSGAEIQYAPGGVLTACKILHQPNTCYFKYPRTSHSGGSLWDYAATACLFYEAGAIATDIFGQPMELNREDSTFMNHRGLLYAAHQSLANEIKALYKKLSQ